MKVFELLSPFYHRPDPLASVSKASELLSLYDDGLLELHLSFSFLLVSPDKGPLLSLRERVILKSIFSSTLLLSGNIREWKVTFEQFLVDPLDQDKAITIALCQIYFLLETKYKLYPCLSRYTKHSRPDGSFRLTIN